VDVSQSAAHFALAMGCARVVMVGFDLCWIENGMRYSDFSIGVQPGATLEERSGSAKLNRFDKCHTGFFAGA